MSITLNSQIHGSSYGSPTTDNACGFSMLWNQIQGEHTLILRTDIKTLSYLSNSWGYLKPFYSITIYPSKHYNITDQFCQFQQLQ
jgi:hypothetical protein